MRFHWLFQFCAWIDQTPLSQWIQAAGWIVPLVQTVHILAVAMVLASATMIALRLAGLIALDETPPRVVARFVPFIWWPLIALAGSGLVLIVGEPGRELLNPIFQAKMVLLLLAITATRWLTVSLNDETASATRPGSPAGAGLAVAPSLRAVATATLLIWVTIIFAGRWIAYF